jgi:predicted membrane channel-forming protein YqfA (hemolysin III family)
MDSVPAEKQNIAKSQFPGANVLLAVSTTLVVGLELATHWRSYGWFNKFVGVILLLSLLGSLLELIRKKEKIDLQGFVTLAYMWLVLATILFGH